jgi:predicted ABC-type transport system involved in lysophospholipase L1 biosynthesis ATPase subunit
MATHDAALAERCDRRIRLIDGRIVADSLTSDAAAAP